MTVKAVFKEDDIHEGVLDCEKVSSGEKEEGVLSEKISNAENKG